jgi:hypothetical protein
MKTGSDHEEDPGSAELQQAALTRLVSQEQGWKCLLARKPGDQALVFMISAVGYAAFALFIVLVVKPFELETFIRHMKMENGIKMWIYAALSYIGSPFVMIALAVLTVDAKLAPRITRSVVADKDEYHDFRQTNDPRPSVFGLKVGTDRFGVPEKVWEIVKPGQEVLVEHTPWFKRVYSVLVKA